MNARIVCVSVLHFADHAEKRTQRDSLFLELQDKFCLPPSVAARNATKVLIRILILEDQTVFIERLLGNLNWRESRAQQLWAATIYPEFNKLRRKLGVPGGRDIDNAA
jgi:hypothetical protein